MRRVGQHCLTCTRSRLSGVAPYMQPGEWEWATEAATAGAETQEVGGTQRAGLDTWFSQLPCTESVAVLVWAHWSASAKCSWDDVAHCMFDLLHMVAPIHIAPALCHG